jgi:hypothetical protein
MSYFFSHPMFLFFARLLPPHYVEIVTRVEWAVLSAVTLRGFYVVYSGVDQIGGRCYTTIAVFVSAPLFAERITSPCGCVIASKVLH